MPSTSKTNGTKHIVPASRGGRYALGRRPWIKENEDAPCTSSLAAITPVDETGSSASKRLKPGPSNEARKSCSGSSAVPSSEHSDIGESSTDGALERASFTDLPPELMFKIFGYLYEDDLAQCTLVSRKFWIVANHRALWEPLYKEVFEYSRLLLHVGHGRFEFRAPHDWPQPQSGESIVVNPWKESFRQLKDGVHVRPGYASLYSGFGAGGRRLTQCDRLDQALRLVRVRGKNAEKLIFLHTGLYIPETMVVINSDIQIIGASAGPYTDIASQVIIEGQLDTTVTLAKGSQGAYLGWMTVRFAPDPRAVAAAIAAGNPPMSMDHFALQICGDSTALVEHCVIHSSATVGAAVCVRGRAANPKMRHCVVCDCESAGIYVTDAAQGQFEDCEIARNNHVGIRVANNASPTVTHCEIHHEQTSGVYVHTEGRGQFTENRIHSNASTGIAIKSHSDPKITRNKIWDNQKGGVIIHDSGQGVLKDNEIFDNAGAGVQIETDGNPMLRRNKIYDGRGGGVFIFNKGRGVLEENEVYGNTLSGISVTEGSSPIIRKNRIHSGKGAGVYFYDNGQGVLEENDIFNHLNSGVRIGTGSNPKITRNKIRGNQEGGVFVSTSGQGVLEDNEIFDNAIVGVEIGTDSNPMLRRNKIYDGRDVGVRIYNKGRGILEDNDIYRNAQAGVIILSELNPTLRRNRVYEGRAAGITIERGAMATLESNAIFHNRFGGLCLATDARPTLRDNKIYDNDDLMEKTIAKGNCLFEILSCTSPPTHDIYHCNTCNTAEMYAICLNCIRTCHAGHDVRLVRCDRFFCCCGAGVFKHQCKLSSKVRDNDSALSSRGLRTAIDTTLKLTVSRHNISM